MNTSFQTPVLWNVYGECENYHAITGAHSGAILDLQFSRDDGRYIYTASTDKTVGVFDSHTGQRIKRLKGHGSYVNSVHPARRGDPLIVSGSDDCSIRVWDQRKRSPVHNLNNTYQVERIEMAYTFTIKIYIFLMVYLLFVPCRSPQLHSMTPQIR